VLDRAHMPKESECVPVIERMYGNSIDSMVAVDHGQGLALPGSRFDAISSGKY